MGQVAGSNTGQYTEKQQKQSQQNILNLHAGQYAGSVGASSDHSQGQALVEPLVLPAGVTRNINKFLCEAIQKRVVNLPYTLLLFFFAETNWLLKHFGHLSHSSI